jgi:CubicO group peptidase (beta-lactamase class C family)
LHMLKALIIFFVFLLNGSIICQTSKSKVIEAAEQIKSLYNEKKFSDIYKKLSPEFKSKTKEQDFVDLLTNDVFFSYSSLENNEYLNEDKERYSFISHFKKGDLRMNISLNDKNEINLFQFVPYQTMPKLKILNYPGDNKKQTPLDTLVDRIVTDYMQSPQNCGLSIGIYQNGKDNFYNYGEIKRNTEILSTPNTIYEIGSLSKTFCGLLLAKAIEEKKVKAADDIRLYLPNDKYDNLETRGKPIQLIHLANHTSGLPRLPEDLKKQPGYDSLNPYKNYSRQMVFNYLKKVKLNSEPGKIFEYSNLGMGLLGIILERVYGKTFEELISEKICKPYNMNNTAVKLEAERLKMFCSGYNAEGKETPYWDLGDLAAAGGIRSTTADMLIYLKTNAEEKDEAIKLSHQPTLNNENAMAWFIVNTKQGNKLLWHNGGTFGFSSFCGFIVEKKYAVVVLSNSAMPVDAIALKILKYLQASL